MAVVVAGEGNVPQGATERPLSANGLLNMARSPNGRRIALMLGAAAVIAIMVGLVLWGRQPDYQVLFSNFSDRDGGEIVSALDAANVPYKFADGGSAILVPADQVHQLRLKLAAQGLPRGGNVGFELMENEKLGISQFLEQVNYQRALEGELARTVQTINAVQAARVHLAIPKSSVFVRDQQAPTASVVLDLYPGRTLDRGQVNAIVHLIASSVPDLTPKNVTIVDQFGNLLSDDGASLGGSTLDPAQLKYVQDLQQNIARRVEAIVAPIVGASNVRAEATADVDFSTSQQAAEIYKPNQTPNSAAIRSQQVSETTGGGQDASGVPGALSNQPAPNATAPLNSGPATGAAANAANAAAQNATGGAQAAPGTAGNGAAGNAATGSAAANAQPTQRDTTTNYEVDKTVRYVQQPMGGLKRLSVAVVVNYKREVGKDGKVTFRPLTDAEKNQISDLVKEAMGYNKDRGDTLNVVNTPFADANAEAPAKVPLWRQPMVIDMAIQALKYLAVAIALFLLYRKMLKPMLTKLASPEPLALGHAGSARSRVPEPEVEPMGVQMPTYKQNLEAAKELARKDPKMVANIVKSWVGND